MLLSQSSTFRRGSMLNGNRIAVFGDSRLARGWLVPSLGAASSTADSIQGWLEFLSGGRVRCPYALNFAVGGDTTTMMLARVDAACAAMVAAGCSTVIFLGSTNDRSVGMAGATSKANIATLFDKFKAAGARVISIAEMPRGDTTFTALRLSGQQLAYHMDVARWLRLRPQYNDNEVCVDVWPELAEKTSVNGDAVLGNLSDGVHLSALSARIVAAKVLSAVQYLFPPWSPALASNADVYSADNPGGCPFQNPGLSGGSGTSLPTGWDAGAAPSGITTSFATLVNGNQRKMQATFGGTPTAAGAYQRLMTQYQESASAVGIVPGNRYRVWWPLEWDALTNIRSIHGYFGMNGVSRTALINQTVTSYPQEAASGVMVVEDVTVPAGATDAQLSIYVVANQAGVATSAVIRASSPLVERVE